MTDSSVSGSFAQYLREKGLIGMDGVASVIEKGIEAARHYQVAAFMLRGPPGVGKTRLAEEYAEYVGAEKLFYQCTIGVGSDDFLYSILPDENAKSGFRITRGVIWRAVEVSRAKKAVLIIDEFDKSRPSTDAFLLDVIQNCRVSISVNGDMVNVNGDKNNLIIFITSNDNREFSEALLRRVICLNISRISTLEVFKILSAEFSHDLALLLAQIYDDTVRAELAKTATIQELRILGRMLMSGADFAAALKSVILKSSEDVQKFTEYVQSRKPYEWHHRRGGSDGEVDFCKVYSSSKKYVLIDSNPTKSSTAPTVPAVKIKKIKMPTKNPEEAGDDIEYCGIFENVDDDAYTVLVKAISPRPSENPCEIGHLKIVKNKGKEYIVAVRPFTLTQIYNLPAGLDGQVYAEDIIALTWLNVIAILSEAEKIRFYTAQKIGAEYVYEFGSCQMLMNFESSEVVVKDFPILLAKVELSGDTRAVKEVYSEIIRRTD
ncbi:MAG: MoxR family ATPase, partial [Candidatus Caldarchaeum sp.]